MSAPHFRLAGTVLGTPDPRGLASFYQQLLGWKVTDEGDNWLTLQPDDDGTGLSFQLEEFHREATWPGGPEDQQMQMHLDLTVDDIEAGVERAVRLGARLSDHQPDRRACPVLIDPAGHPFCLFLP